VTGPFGEAPAFESTSPDGATLALFEVAAQDAPAAQATPAAPSQSTGAAGTPEPAPRAALPALLLVHGATADHTTWRTVGPALASTRRVLAIDRRGRGASTDGTDYSIEREYDDIAAVAQALAATTGGPIDVVGHSYGGRVALGASLRTPAIRRLVVYEGAPVPPGESYGAPGLVEDVRAALDRGDNEAALSTFLQGIVGLSDAALDSYRSEPVWPARVAAAPTILREIEAEASPAASIDALGRATEPVLLILGSVSRSPFRIGTDALAERLADARVEVIKGAAHAAHHTHVDAFVRIVEAFLDR
jgi:pimeloyl-ACP methyl ester carboxylesterase